MATKTKTKKPAQKTGFARLSKAKRAAISSLGGKAAAKKLRKLQAAAQRK